MTLPTEVAVCIPAYRAEAFIERTLGCARKQTHKNLKIIVSIDGSFDDTEAICTRIARSDPRIQVVVQDGQLGWTQNANAALSLADSEFFFVYFHDDIIEDTYVEQLLDALQSRPDAASAHCDLVEFGLVNTTHPAHNYTGNTIHRLVDFMITKRGTTLRSMMRRSSVGDYVRFPDIHGNKHWAAYVFHLSLLAMGPSIAINAPLYRRWQREGSLTRSESWRFSGMEELLQGQHEFAEACSKLFDRVLADSQDKAVAERALVIFQRLFVRRQQLRLGNKAPLHQNLAWEPGWFENFSIAEETRELLDEGERMIKALEEHFT